MFIVCVSTHMVSTFTFRPLTCLFILLYAVRYGSNFIFFRIVNKLSCTVLKKVDLPISRLCILFQGLAILFPALMTTVL